MGILEALAGVGGAGIKGYQGAKKSNQQFNLRKLANLMDVMGMQQRQENFEGGVERRGIERQEDIAHRTGREAVQDRRFESGQLQTALNREARMVSDTRAVEDQTARDARLHGYDVELQKLKDRDGGGQSLFGDTELDKTTINAAIRFAQSMKNYPKQNKLPFAFYFNQAINAAKGQKDPSFLGPSGKVGFGKPDKKQNIDDEIKQLEKELGL